MSLLKCHDYEHMTKDELIASILYVAAYADRERLSLTSIGIDRKDYALLNGLDGIEGPFGFIKLVLRENY